MTHDHSALISQLDVLKGADPADVFAELIRAGLQALIDAEATEVALRIDALIGSRDPRVAL